MQTRRQRNARLTRCALFASGHSPATARLELLPSLPSTIIRTLRHHATRGQVDNIKNITASDDVRFVQDVLSASRLHFVEFARTTVATLAPALAVVDLHAPIVLLLGFLPFHQQQLAQQRADLGV